MSDKQPGSFGVRNGIGPNMPAICIYGRMDDGRVTDKVFVYRVSWVGAYFGTWWRNLLGPFYVPLNPEWRWEIECARRAREVI